MSWTSLFIFLLVLYMAYLFYVPVPEGIEGKFRYRTAVAARKIMTYVVAIHDWLYPGASSHAQFVRRFLKTSPEAGESFAPRVKLSKEVFDGVNVYVYFPPEVSESDLLPGFIYLHGGGLTVQSVDSYDGLTRQMSERLNAVVISVDYRLTPEHKFPVPYEDSFKATRWFLQHANQYGVDPDRVAVGGDSAGGFLAATVAQGIHDDAEVPNLKLQVLVYPWLQMVDFKTPSYQQYPDDMNTLQAMVWYSSIYVYGEDVNPDIMQAFKTNNHTSREFRNSAIVRERLSHSLIPPEIRATSVYSPPIEIENAPISEIGEKIWAESEEVFSDPRSCPLLRKDLSGLPAAYIITAEIDSIRDDGIMYAKLLEQAGVNVTWRHYNNVFHGMMWLGPSVVYEEGRKMLDEMLDFVNSRL